MRCPCFEGVKWSQSSRVLKRTSGRVPTRCSVMQRNEGECECRVEKKKREKRLVKCEQNAVQSDAALSCASGSIRPRDFTRFHSQRALKGGLQNQSKDQSSACYSFTRGDERVMCSTSCITTHFVVFHYTPTTPCFAHFLIPQIITASPALGTFLVDDHPRP